VALRSGTGVYGTIAIRDKKVVGVFVRFSCTSLTAQLRQRLCLVYHFTGYLLAGYRR
jgi:hypothetical protein